ncbi:PREDICTED: T-cell surface glycoprotein CD4 [Hipposideros armiger]|uniref:T-cell surface glycoprotein CD4 n=1 Tax=Hipposideros armiger TaxID=186990 RepID=A0A8B7Q372_HIPAR|nr:PREDICTED: T-cell surface glycoprotein CD4 [Hipposideros armiger]XP_019483204.1 PREDICTED: T-cell surface glycoprotein CD4 [Hipposideros armiger]
MNWGTSFRNLLLLLQLALLPAVIQGEELVLGQAGDTAELPCNAAQKKNIPFYWKHPSGVKILGTQGTYSPTFWVTGTSKLQKRVESKKFGWDQGQFPLIIKDLDIGDSGIYLCEVEGKTTEVKLMVFKLNLDIRNIIHLLPGQSLTLILESTSDSDPLVEWKDPENRKHHEGKSFSLQPESQKSGTWTCTVSKNGKRLVFNINILVLAFQKAPDIVYTKEGEPAEFSFPLTFYDNVNLKGELRWQEKRASSPKPCITFSLDNKKVSVPEVPQGCRFKMKDSLPLHFSLPKALPQDAGSGNFILFFNTEQLRKEVKLVVMRVTQSQNNLTCEVLGPSSPKLTLSLKLEDQATKVSNQQKVVKVLDPETGTWQCLLKDKHEVLLESKVEVLPTVSTWAWPKLLAIVLGGIAGFLIFTGLCIFCCVKCRHRRRQAERMSQIKRLLSEKKTCQCPHRFQKTCSLI